MSVEWFKKSPGSPIQQSQEDPTMLLIDLDGKPDWVRVPDAISKYAGQHRCTEIRPGRCPLSGHEHACRHYVLEGIPVGVAECAVDQKIVFYLRRQGEKVE
jgi:hypothetical protein